MTAPTDLRNEGQHRSLWPLTDQCREDFMRIVAAIPIGALWSVNSIRPELDLAQIPDKARGGLMSGAIKAGLCEEAREVIEGFGVVVLHVPSTGARTNASGVKVYRRTNPREG
jgi:hypothetical protein